MRSLGDRNQHDVHHAEAADDQGDRSHHQDQQAQGHRSMLDRFAKLVAVEQHKVFNAMALGQQLADGTDGGFVIDVILQSYADAA
ncbi:hypothetical protein D3C80_1851350 [compost metagenome]